MMFMIPPGKTKNWRDYTPKAQTQQAILNAQYHHWAEMLWSCQHHELDCP